jgi:hypothetical protein
MIRRMVLDAVRRVRRGHHVLIPISAETCGHRTQSAAALWQDHLAGLLKRTRA